MTVNTGLNQCCIKPCQISVSCLFPVGNKYDRKFLPTVELRERENGMFVLSGLFLIHFFLVIFSLLYLALRKKLCIKDHKDPKNLCEKHRCFNYK